MDVSPAPLFPYVDLDTSILLLYSRGDRSCLTYEVHPEEVKGKQLQKLPSFEHATLQLGWAFLPKKGNDVQKVEILSSLRLTSTTVERVSWGVPRAKIDFFQDDIFVPTRDVETATLGAEEWLAGKNVPLALVDLRPHGMTLCGCFSVTVRFPRDELTAVFPPPVSEAPSTASRLSTRSQVGAVSH